MDKVTGAPVSVQGGQDKLEDGVCGSAIWDDDGAVIGFLRYTFIQLDSTTI